MHKLHAALGEFGAADGGRGCRREIGRVCPATDTEEDFEVAICFFEDVELLKAAVEVGAIFGPAVCGVVLFEVGVGVGEVTMGVGEAISWEAEDGYWC